MASTMLPKEAHGSFSDTATSYQCPQAEKCEKVFCEFIQKKRKILFYGVYTLYDSKNDSFMEWNGKEEVRCLPIILKM